MRRSTRPRRVARRAQTRDTLCSDRGAARPRRTARGTDPQSWHRWRSSQQRRQQGRFPRPQWRRRTGTLRRSLCTSQTAARRASRSPLRAPWSHKKEARDRARAGL
eukprot:Amastigsp_a177374_26.p5 type:complete len:106 gc:universal Amastigsp_a177374_26:1216-899(-)